MKAITLMYHDVVDPDRADESGFPGRHAGLYKLEHLEFRKHLQAVAGAAEKPVTVFDLRKHEGRGTPLLLTFDDGGASAYRSIADSLEELGWRGHFLITTDYIGDPSFVSEGQIRELHRRGHVIGTHSCSHPLRMAACEWDELLREWGRSVQILSDMLGERVTVASVPGGYYHRKVAEAASRMGIEVLFTSEPVTRCRRVDQCQVLGRYTIQRWTSARVAAGLASGQTGPRLGQSLLWNAKKITKSLGGQYYLKATQSLLRSRAEL